MPGIHFGSAFEALTGHAPFPWQRALYEQWFSQGKVPPSCNLPTGLGKTSVIAVWLIALANGAKVPRRLVYVVNRRTVVDQTTDEVEGYAQLLAHGRPPLLRELIELSDALRQMCADPEGKPLAISTLRGQFADNREWSADPSRPAVICGTVDLIGSRLLFSGYGCGFKTRPLHAGFLGQDSLVVHDEAHLEPAFQKLLLAIEEEQKRCKDFRPLKVMELTATSRAGDTEPFELTTEERNPPEDLPEPPTEPIHRVWRRLRAKKGLQFYPAKRGEVARRIGELARGRAHSGKAVLVFVRTIDDVKSVQDALTDKRNGGVAKEQVQTLTGTLRGLERDSLAKEDRIFARFLSEPKVEPQPGTVYLVCTSAGEVGVDISADDMVCDLTTLESMAQRLGRVNRRGDGAAFVDVVYETDSDPKTKSPAMEAARWKAKSILGRLPKCDWSDRPHEASPLALRNLFEAEDGAKRKELDEERKAAFAPTPTILPTSDILFDAWALTTIRDRLPGRPHVEPYLHGLAEWQPPETHVAWREEVSQLPLLYKSESEQRELTRTERKQLAEFAEDLLEDYPLKPHELLRDRSDRVFKHLGAIAARNPDTYAWLVDDEGGIEVFTLKELADKDKKDRIERRAVLLPPEVGGLRDGLLDGSASEAGGLDVADDWFADKEKKVPRRLRVWGATREADARLERMRLIRRIDFPTGEEDGEGRVWFWFELPQGGDSEGSKSNRLPVSWATHTKDVVCHTTAIVGKLLPDLADLFRIAAECHDLGKKRKLFQAMLGNANYPAVELAKSGKKGGRIAERYRHEFGSLLDAEAVAEFATLDDNLKALVLHLIAAHHGRGRPHFPTEEAFDPKSNGRDAGRVAREVPQRFARLQRKYGRWGLAYLESLLRAADYAASACPSKFAEDAS